MLVCVRSVPRAQASTGVIISMVPPPASARPKRHITLYPRRQALKHRVMARAALKYAAMQLPGITLIALILLLIRQQFDLSGWLVAAVIAVWVLKDAALFPLVWRYYSPYPPPPLHRLEGRRGIVHEPLAPSGYVRLGHELWRAEVPPGHARLKRGAHVRVRGVRGLTLLVEPDEPPAR
jgi:membrane protein implicated in regulation of membrane protease activity